MNRTILTLLFIGSSLILNAQKGNVIDGFEGNGTINSWYGDACEIIIGFNNPYRVGINQSAYVLKYFDSGGQYANVRFDVPGNFDLSVNHTFSIKIYVPSDGLTGNQPNQVSLKLQNGTLASPWTTQSEIIKAIQLDQWQTVSFDFESDNYINFDPGSLPPAERTDFNRVLIQVNGENNYDHVLAYIDDVYYDGTIADGPEFDQLVWSDEFNTDGPVNASRWFHQTQLPLAGGWYNGEVQHYTDRVDNSFVEDGVLKIVAKREMFTDQGFTKEFTSARLNSKYALLYGRVEVRAKLPAGTGTWPAIWMLGKNIDEDGAYWDNMGYGTTLWPECGEIDIMEHWGNNQDYVQSAIHTPSSYGGTVNLGGRYISNASTEFHIYAMEWTENKLVFSVDDIVHYTYMPAVRDASTWPFDKEQYLLLNIAVLSSIEASFTSSVMEVDYVRFYQESPVSVANIYKEIPPDIFPNPFSNEINIRIESAAERNIFVNIYSIDGMLIRKYNMPFYNGIIKISNLGGLSRGIYILEFVSGSEKQSFKIIKK